MKKLLGILIFLAAPAFGQTTINGGRIINNFVTVVGSETVQGAGGLNVTYGAVLGSATVSNLTPSRCVETGAGGLLTSAAAACGTGGGGGDSLGSHTATMTVTANYGITATSFTATSFSSMTGVEISSGITFVTPSVITATTTLTSSMTLVFVQPAANTQYVPITLPPAATRPGLQVMI